MISRRTFVKATAAAAASCGLYAWRVEPYWVDVVHRSMPLHGLPPQLVGRTLLQLSDLHVGPVDPAYLAESLRRCTALKPDFVIVTGDFVSYDSAEQLDDLTRMMQHLPHGRIATIASLGNHDYGIGWSDMGVADRVTRIVTDAGALVLRNASHHVGGLQFAGLGDLWSPEWNAAPAATLAALERDVPTVVLSHNPDTLDLPIWDGIRGWVLAGHTHGGQCKPPFLPPPILPVRNKRYTSGIFDIAPGRTLYINRGLGYFLPVRFNVRPEITLFTLTNG